MKINKLIILSLLATLAVACGHTTKTAQTYTSLLRPNELLNMGKTYIDTVTYVGSIAEVVSDDWDGYWKLEVGTNQLIVMYGKGDFPDGFEFNDEVEVHWQLDSVGLEVKEVVKEVKLIRKAADIPIPIPSIHQEFISYFPDMVFGKHTSKHKRIPHKIAAEFLPDLLRDEWTNAKMYAVGKISNYKGLDLFIIDYEDNRPDEETYDNHTDSLRFLILFKNNAPVMDKEDPERRLCITLNSHYYGEGGEGLFKSYFDMDTTLVCHQYDSESESATGYGTPFNSTKEYRAAITGKGEKEIREVTKMEFSSPFYDRNFLKEHQTTWWEDVDDEGFNYSYPTKDNKWNLYINVWYDENPALINPPVYLLFHIEKIDGELIPIFETYSDEQHKKQLDKYVIGQVRNDVLVKKDYANRNKILKCPIIIKTSDGDLEMLPDGKFRLNHKK